MTTTERTALGAAEAISGTEFAIVEGLANGYSSKEMSTQLQRSCATVEYHVRALFLKLNARSRAQIVARAFEFGILPAERSATLEQRTQHV